MVGLQFWSPDRDWDLVCRLCSLGSRWESPVASFQPTYFMFRAKNRSAGRDWSPPPPGGMDTQGWKPGRTPWPTHWAIDNVLHWFTREARTRGEHTPHHCWPCTTWFCSAFLLWKPTYQILCSEIKQILMSTLWFARTTTKMIWIPGLTPFKTWSAKKTNT